MSGLGNKPDGWRSDSDGEQPMAERILALLSVMAPEEPTTGHIALRLAISPMTAERDALSRALTTLRGEHMVKFEHSGDELAWRLTSEGRDYARRLRIVALPKLTPREASLRSERARVSEAG